MIKILHNVGQKLILTKYSMKTNKNKENCYTFPLLLNTERTKNAKFLDVIRDEK